MKTLSETSKTINKCFLTFYLFGNKTVVLQVKRAPHTCVSASDSTWQEAICTMLSQDPSPLSKQSVAIATAAFCWEWLVPLIGQLEPASTFSSIILVTCQHHQSFSFYKCSLIFQHDKRSYKFKSKMFDMKSLSTWSGAPSATARPENIILSPGAHPFWQHNLYTSSPKSDKQK